MNFPVIQQSINVKEFVMSWSKFYFYKNYDRYRELLAKKSFTDAELRELFEWKNGMNLSSKKDTSYDENIKTFYPEIHALKDNFDEDIFRYIFKDVSAIWQIFLLHILRPDVYPIFDQHVYRAYQFLHAESIVDLPVHKGKVLDIYYSKYLLFFKSLLQLDQTVDRYELDKALWVYGKLIKEPKKSKGVTE